MPANYAGILQGGGSGAAAGMALGPYGALGGALLGGTLGSGALGGQSAPGPRESIRLAAQGTTKAYAQTAPLSLALNQLYQPAYLSQGSQNLQQLLFGTPEQQYSNAVGWKMDSKGRPTATTTISGTIPGSEGLLDTLGRAQPRFQQLQNQANDTYRQNNFDQISKYLPQAQALYDQSNPEMAALQKQIGADASQQLALGDMADPETVARWRNQNTAQYANMGFRPNNDFVQADSLLKYYGGSQQLQGQRQGYALNALNQLSQTTPNYAQFILGQNDPSLQQAQGFLGAQQSAAYQGNSYDPFNANTTSLYNRGAEQQLASNAYGYNQSMGALQGATNVGAAAYNAFKPTAQSQFNAAGSYVGG